MFIFFTVLYYYPSIPLPLIGGYGNRRDHPDIPSLSSLSPEPPYTTFRSSIPPKVPPKVLSVHNKSGIKTSGQVDTAPNGLPLQQKDCNTICNEGEHSITHLGMMFGI